MDGIRSSFEFAYDASDIHYGRGCLDRLSSVLAECGLDRALVVCGATVGDTPAVIDPVLEGLDSRLVGVFDETAPSKNVSLAWEAVSTVRDTEADVLVGLGGGSSLDLAKATAILTASDRSFDEILSTIAADGRLPIPDHELLPIVSVPTTLAGADLSTAGSVTIESDRAAELQGTETTGGFADERLMPLAGFYEPSLFASTPADILAASAMNGFDKGIEMLYSRNATPITDATASHGLSLLKKGLPGLRDVEPADPALDASIIGTILVQYGLSVPGASKLSIIHAFGHGLARNYSIQQGAAHAIMAPHAVRFVFDRIPGRRTLLADALDINQESQDVAGEIIQAVTSIRDELGLPARLRSIPDLDHDDLPAIARYTHEDPILTSGPEELDPSVSELTALLENAW